MKHTDFYDTYKAIDNLACNELIAAIKAHGGAYNFESKATDFGMPVILASFKHAETTEEYYVSRVEVNENDHLSIFGYPKCCNFCHEDLLYYIPSGQYEEITELIPETKDVQDVSMPNEDIITILKQNKYDKRRSF